MYKHCVVKLSKNKENKLIDLGNVNKQKLKTINVNIQKQLQYIIKLKTTRFLVAANDRLFKDLCASTQ